MKVKDENSFLEPFLDILFCMLLCCIAIIMILKSEQENTVKAPSKNSLYEVILIWDAKSKTDIDLHMFDGESHVSFQRREGGPNSLSSLNHDSLGLRNSWNNEKTPEKHEEIISIRGLKKTEHIVNVHVYNFQDAEDLDFQVKLIKVKPYKVLGEVSMKCFADDEVYMPFRFMFDETGGIENLNTNMFLDIVHKN